MDFREGTQFLKPTVFYNLVEEDEYYTVRKPGGQTEAIKRPKIGGLPALEAWDLELDL